MSGSEIREGELDLFLRKIEQQYGYDFSEYYPSSFQRRLKFFLDRTPSKSLTECLEQLLIDKSYFYYFLSHVLVSVTEMFRDPPFFQAVIEKIIPALRSCSHFKIWHAGCATGEEVYSLAILLKEMGLAKRAMLYATDINLVSLKMAREGIYTLEHMEQAAGRYLEAGGKASLSNYYNHKYGFAKMHEHLKENIIFSNHNLVSDGVFGDIQVIICRNVLIYFSRGLQNKVLNLFSQSLISRGFLCLGPKESLEFSDVRNALEVISKKEQIYRKVAAAPL